MTSVDTKSVAFVLTVGALVFAPELAAQGGALAPAEAGAWTPELALQVRRIRDVTVSPDGERVAFVVEEVDTTGPAPRWESHIRFGPTDESVREFRTRGGERDGAPAWSPDGSWIGFLSSRGSWGREIWRIRSTGGEAERVTDAPTDVSAFAWSPDGRHVAYLAAEVPAGASKADDDRWEPKVAGEGWRRTRLHVVPLAPLPAPHPEPLTPGDVHVTGVFVGRSFTWSPDGVSIAFSHAPTPDLDAWSSLDLSLVDVETGEIRALAAGPTAEGAPTFSRDGRQVAWFVSDGPGTWAPTGMVHVLRLDEAGGAPRPLAATRDRRPDILGWTPDDQGLVFGEVDGTVRRVGMLPTDGAAPRDLTPSDAMIAGPALNAAGTHIGFVTEAPNRPPEPAVTTLDPFRPLRIGQIQELPDVPMGRTEVIRWSSDDALEIEGLLTYPVGYRAGQRVPLLLVLHGGPPGVFTQRFIGSRGAYPLAAFAARGYAILRPNPRGSGGYGRDFRYANREDWGGGDYRDIMSGVDALIERGVADPDRLGVMGWSYGGYLTARTITQTGRFRAASVGAGITNLISYTGTADIPSFVPDYFDSEFWEREDLWLERSPIHQVERVTTPTLIQHGSDDVRVPTSQGYELYHALRRRGISVEMVVYPGEPHSLRAPEALLDAMHRNLAWFQRWVPPEGEGSGTGGAAVRPGVEGFLRSPPAAVRGARVGLITNHTGVDSRGRSTADLLAGSDALELVALFGPEHGVRGVAPPGEKIDATVDEKTGLSVHSLYGETLKPTAEMLRGVDALVFDIQDIGARQYTYISTMALAMQAAAEAGIPFVVLDRPNPIAGHIIEGNILDRDFSSFVGLYPIPVRHGMTVGELARLFNDRFAIGVELTVVPAEGWSRSMWYDETGLPWINPSPNIRSLEAASHYPGTVFIEATNLSEGRGTPTPFRQVGAPWLRAVEVTDSLNARRFPGVRFEAVTLRIEPDARKYPGETIPGIRLIVTDREAYRPLRTTLLLIDLVRRLHPGSFAWRGEDRRDDGTMTIMRHGGTDRLLEAYEAGRLEALLAEWKEDARRFREIRAPYLLYE